MNKTTKERTAKNLNDIQPPKVDTSLEDPCTCGKYPYQDCVGTKQCPHE